MAGVLAACLSGTWMVEDSHAQLLRWLSGRSAAQSDEDLARRSDTAGSDRNPMPGADPSDGRSSYPSPLLTLLDAARHQTHDYPEAFLLTTSELEDASDLLPPFESDFGYRVQILSTRRVSQADSIRQSFRLWADTTFSGVVPEAYLFFKPPHYRIHVGDFLDREQANRFARLLKGRYRDAWVVHDRIDPERAGGAATVEDGVQEPSETGPSESEDGGQDDAGSQAGDGGQDDAGTGVRR